MHVHVISCKYVYDECLSALLSILRVCAGPAIIYLSTEKFENIAIETITFTKTDRVPGVWNQPRPLGSAGGHVIWIWM